MSNASKEKRLARHGRRSRVRKKVRGTSEKPRLCVFRSLDHIYAQLIDDDAGKTLVQASSLKMKLPEEAPKETEKAEEGKKGKGAKKRRPEGLKIRRSRAVGKEIAKLAREKNISKVVFDRSGFLYHGRVAALAESARENGLEF